MQVKTILITSQDNPGARSLSILFRQVGYRVETAEMVSDVIRKVRSREHQVVLLGDEVEGVKACDLVSLLKKINGKVQVIVISSDESLGSVRRLRGAGIFYQAMKPVDFEELKCAVGCAFEKIEREHSLREGFSLF